MTDNKLGLQTGPQCVIGASEFGDDIDLPPETHEQWIDRINAEGLHTSAPLTIKTWTGRHVNPQNMRPSDIDITDIAHALARICRYGGHTFGHLSVARHSLWVADRLHRLYPGDYELELWGLLHDAGEAYLGDMVRPMKHSAAMVAFRDADDRLDSIIAHRFRLPWPQPPQVAEADTWVLNNREQGEHGARYTWLGNHNRDEAQFTHRYHALTEAS